jgi:hypothetical protein
MVKNTEGSFRQVLKDMLADERPKLPLRFSLKKNIQYGKIENQFHALRYNLFSEVVFFYQKR